jgi:hypothetical protein
MLQLKKKLRQNINGFKSFMTGENWFLRTGGGVEVARRPGVEEIMRKPIPLPASW